MSLSRVVDAIADRLSSTLVGPPATGAAEPATPADLPAVVIAVEDAGQTLTAIGARPAPSRTGALPVSQSHDLADPTLTFPDGEVVDLVGPDRRVLHFAYGPVVASDGTEVDALASADLAVELDGSPVDVVTSAPAAGEVRGDPALGELTFGTPLPATGTVRADYWIGEWEVATQRYQGTLVVSQVAATAAAVDSLTREVEAALARAVAPAVPGLFSLRPIAFGPIGATEGAPAMRRQALRYQFDFEAEDPVLGTGGGLIARIAVDATFGPEQFDVTREGSSRE